MIERKELLHKEYADDSKTCIGFQYIVNGTDVINKDEQIARFIFERCKTEGFEKIWRVQICLRSCFSNDVQNLLQFTFAIPKDNMPLELVCAMGLNVFKNMLKSQIQDYSNLDFTIGEVTRGM